MAAQLVMMAFLHRMLNGHGALDLGDAIRTRRMDLCLRYGGPEPPSTSLRTRVTLGIELKVWRDGEEEPIEEGLAQFDSYLNGLGLPSGWLALRPAQRPAAHRQTHHG